MESSSKNKAIVVSTILLITLCAITASTTNAASLIYNNTTKSGFVMPLSSGKEVIDYGRTNDGGLVTSFTFGFETDTNYPGTVKVRFYEGTNYYSRGGLIATFQLTLPYVSNTNYSQVLTYSIPTNQQFILPPGPFGYSLEFSNNSNYAVYARDGLGNEAYFWAYVYDDWDWSWSWERVYASSSANSGIYMKVYADPPPLPPFADITGYKFDDTDADGIWDNSEPAMQGWRIYVDENNNGLWESTEPNAITDPNGFYKLIDVDAPASHTVAEQMQAGWTQTLPGGSTEAYTVSTEPNQIYENNNFGNTTKPVVTTVTISGHVREYNGTPIQDVTVGLLAFITQTDQSGYYELTLPVNPFTGTITPTKECWEFEPASLTYWQLASDKTNANFTAILTCPYGDGDGTEESPYQIWTAQQMNQIGLNEQDWASNFILMDDIDMSIYQGNSYNQIGTTNSLQYTNHTFRGDFNGNGYSISNLTIKSTNTDDYLGLFGVIYGGKVHHLTLINPNIDTPNTNYVGAIAGYIKSNSSITNCDVIGGYINGSQNIGGVLGYLDSATITSNSNTAAVTGDYDLGGLVGHAKGGAIYNSYSTGNVTGTNNCGGFVGSIERYTRISKCYSTGEVTAVNLAGGFIASNSTGRFDRCFWDIETSLQSSSAAATGQTTELMKTADTYAGWGCSNVWVIQEGIDYPKFTWSNFQGLGSPLPVPTYGSGSGSQEDPFLIYTTQQFIDIGRYDCHLLSYFKLMNDIVLDSDEDNNFYPIGASYTFFGSFDGNNHKIINPRYTQTDSGSFSTGIFASMNLSSSGTPSCIKNLGIVNPQISSDGGVVGGLLGSFSGGTVENCYIEDGTITGLEAVGGIAGTMQFQETNLIKSCYSTVTVAGTQYIGGLVGYFTDGTITNSYAGGLVLGDTETGGLVGYHSIDNITVNNSFYDMDITLQSEGPGTPENTEQMIMQDTYASAGWDFDSTWRICDNLNYPKLAWQAFVPGDITCPDGVGIEDLAQLSSQWMLTGNLTADIAPQNGDNEVNEQDLKVITENWLSGR